MGYSSNDGRVRVDLFNSRGAWSGVSGSIDMNGHYQGNSVYLAVYNACVAEHAKGDEGEWPITCPMSPREWMEKGGTIVVLEPYHASQQPVMLSHGKPYPVYPIEPASEGGES